MPLRLAAPGADSGSSARATSPHQVALVAARWIEATAVNRFWRRNVKLLQNVRSDGEVRRDGCLRFAARGRWAAARPLNSLQLVEAGSTRVAWWPIGVCKGRLLGGRALTAAELETMFLREQPNQLWCTDITEHPTREGKVYCAVVLDVFSRRVVGWSLSHRPTSALTSNALRMAFEQRDAERGETVIHSDPGDAVHLLGVHRTSATIRTRTLFGLGRRLLRQRDDRSVPVADASRAAQHEPLEDPSRAHERDLRAHRDLPQQAPTPLAPRHANTDRI